MPISKSAPGLSMGKSRGEFTDTQIQNGFTDGTALPSCYRLPLDLEPLTEPICSWVKGGFLPIEWARCQETLTGYKAKKIHKASLSLAGPHHPIFWPSS